MMARYDSRARERWYAGAFAGRLLGRFECEQRDPQARDRAQSVGLDDHFSPAEEHPNLLTAEGQCSAAGSDQEPVPLGIALHMTECQVVRLAGPVEKFELGSDSRDQRLLVLTYLQGPHPGIYRFSGGRLVVIQRAPSPGRGLTAKAKGRENPSQQLSER
jgi:hypothetical protein